MRKEWYHVTAPHPFENRLLGMTCVNRKQGMITEKDGLMGRCLTVCLADLNNKAEGQSGKEFKL